MAWFWQRKRTDNNTAAKLIALLNEGLADWSTEGIYDVDNKLLYSPRLVTLSRVLRRPDAERFHPISYDFLVEAVGQSQREGRIDQTLNILAGQPGFLALILGAMHEIHLRKHGSSTQRSSEDIRAAQMIRELLRRLNLGSSTK